MQAPSRLLRRTQNGETPKNFPLPTASWRLSSANYIKSKLDSVRPQLINAVYEEHSDIKLVVLDLINKQQIYTSRNLAWYKIIPVLKYKDEQKQLPPPPTAIDEIASYTMQLASIPNFELTKNNVMIKADLFSSLRNETDSIDKNLIKSLLIYEIMNLRTVYDTRANDQISDYFRLLDYDTDTHYLISLLYFMNPHGLDLNGRLNQVIKILSNFKAKMPYKVNTEDWEFLIRLTNSNLNTFDTAHQTKFSFLFSKLTSLATDVHSSYWRHDLVGMLRFLRNAESGYEDLAPNSQQSGVVRFNINYFRFIILERAIREWNKDSLTGKTWDQYNFENQWKTVWDMYYDNNHNDLSPPGGPSIKNHVRKIVGL